MGAEEYNLTPQLEAEFNPHVTIIANSDDRYRKFAVYLEANDFPCRLLTSVGKSDFENVRPGTIFFVSFNLQSSDPVLAAKTIDQKLRMTCIVFAEEEGLQTAAALSSAKMPQTLQYPYTEKNFLAAVQSVVKKRKEDFEKEQRKLNHIERKRGQVAAVPVTDLGVIIQEGAPQLIDPTAKVFKGIAHRSVTIVQPGARPKKFLHLQKGEATKGFVKVFTMDGPSPAGSRAHPQPVQGSKLPPQKATTAERTRKLREQHTGERAFVLKPLPEPPPDQDMKASAKLTSTTENGEEYSPSTRWAVLSVSLVGILVCLYCCYLMIFPHY